MSVSFIMLPCLSFPEPLWDEEEEEEEGEKVEGDKKQS